MKIKKVFVIIFLIVVVAVLGFFAFRYIQMFIFNKNILAVPQKILNYNLQQTNYDNGKKTVIYGPNFVYPCDITISQGPKESFNFSDEYEVLNETKEDVSIDGKIATIISGTYTPKGLQWTASITRMIWDENDKLHVEIETPPFCGFSNQDFIDIAKLLK